MQYNDAAIDKTSYYPIAASQQMKTQAKRKEREMGM
jgi:hypothetical protein